MLEFGPSGTRTHDPPRAPDQIGRQRYLQLLQLQAGDRMYVTYRQFMLEFHEAADLWNLEKNSPSSQTA